MCIRSMQLYNAVNCTILLCLSLMLYMLTRLHASVHHASEKYSVLQNDALLALSLIRAM